MKCRGVFFEKTLFYYNGCKPVCGYFTENYIHCFHSSPVKVSKNMQETTSTKGIFNIIGKSKKLADILQKWSIVVVSSENLSVEVDKYPCEDINIFLNT